MDGGLWNHVRAVWGIFRVEVGEDGRDCMRVLESRLLTVSESESSSSSDDVAEPDKESSRPALFRHFYPTTSVM